MSFLGINLDKFKKDNRPVPGGTVWDSMPEEANIPKPSEPFRTLLDAANESLRVQAAERRRQLASGEVRPMSLVDAMRTIEPVGSRPRGLGGYSEEDMPSYYRGRTDPMQEEMYRMMRYITSTFGDLKVAIIEMRTEIADMQEQLASINFYKE